MQTKSNFIFYGKLAVAAATLYFLSRAIPVRDLTATLDAARPGYLFAAASLLGLNLLAQAGKWWYLLRIAQTGISAKTAWRSLIVGFPLGFVTPGRLGEIGRALYVPELSQSRTFALLVIDKVATALITLTVGLTGLLMLPGLGFGSNLRGAFAVCLALLLGFILFAVSRPRIAGLCQRFSRTDAFTPRHVSGALLWSLLFYATFLGQLVLLVHALGHTGRVLDSAQAAACVFLVKTVLPFAFGDLGIREGAAVFFFGKNGVPAAAALQASLLLFVINVGLPALLGLPVLLRTRRELRP